MAKQHTKGRQFEIEKAYRKLLLNSSYGASIQYPSSIVINLSKSK
jgi:hypothetical protein